MGNPEDDTHVTVAASEDSIRVQLPTGELAFPIEKYLNISGCPGTGHPADHGNHFFAADEIRVGLVSNSFFFYKKTGCRNHVFWGQKYGI